MTKFITAAFLLIFTTFGVQAAPALSQQFSAKNTLPAGSFEMASPGGWFSITGCFKRRKAAKRHRRNVGGRVVNTRNYPNFRNGYHCVVKGPRSKRRARNYCSTARADGYGCYIKRGW